MKTDFFSVGLGNTFFCPGMLEKRNAHSKSFVSFCLFYLSPFLSMPEHRSSTVDDDISRTVYLNLSPFLSLSFSFPEVVSQMQSITDFFSPDKATILKTE